MNSEQQPIQQADAAAPSRWPSVMQVLLGFAALMAYTVSALHLWSYTLYADLDGEYDIVWARQIFQYASSPIDQSVISPVKGMGGLLMPLAVQIHPAYWPFALSSSPIDPRVLSYLVVIIVASLSTYWLGRTIGLPPLGAVLGAQLLVVPFFPPMITFYLEQLSLAHMHAFSASVAWPTCLATLYLVALLHLGRGSRRTSLAALVAMPLLVLYSILCDPLFSTVIFLPAAPLSVGILLGSRDRRMFLWRLGGLGLCLAVLVLCGVPGFYGATMGYAARLYFPTEISEGDRNFKDAAFGFQNLFSAVAAVLAMCGYLAVVVLGRRQQRWWAVAVLGIAVSLLAASLLFLYGDMEWTKPRPSYYEHGALPAYVVTLLLGVYLSWQKLRRSELVRQRAWRLQGGWRLAGRAVPWLSVVLIPAMGFVIAWQRPTVADLEAEGMRSPALEPDLSKAGPIFHYLRRHLATGHGQPFRGSVASLVGSPGGDVGRFIGLEPGEPFGEQCIEATTIYLQKVFPELHLAGLWRQGIPTLEDYNHLATPPMYFLFSRALAQPEHIQTKNHLTVSRARPGLLAALGVRYLLADRPLKDPRLKLRRKEEKELHPIIAWWLLSGSIGIEDRQLWAHLIETSGLRTTLRLYEIAGANLGDLSPVEVRQVSSAMQAVEILCSEQFPFRKRVVLCQPLRQAALVPADEAQMIFERGGVRVKAHSGGTSLLVLPLEFSHSLRIVSGGARQPDALPRLLRANLVQTGVLFRGDLNIKISNDFGVLGRISGRWEDIADCHRLGISEQQPRRVADAR